MSDLSLETFDDLWKELDSRLDDYVFYGRRKCGKSEAGNDLYSYRREWKGDQESASLLTIMLQRKITDDHIENEADPELWEEL